MPCMWAHKHTRLSSSVVVVVRRRKPIYVRKTSNARVDSIFGGWAGSGPEKIHQDVRSKRMCVYAVVLMLQTQRTRRWFFGVSRPKCSSLFFLRSHTSLPDALRSACVWPAKSVWSIVRVCVCRCVRVCLVYMYPTNPPKTPHARTDSRERQWEAYTLESTLISRAVQLGGRDHALSEYVVDWFAGINTCLFAQWLSIIFFGLGTNTHFLRTGLWTGIFGRAEIYTRTF